MKVRWVVRRSHQTLQAELGHPALAVAEIDRFFHHPRAGMEQALQQRHLEGIAEHADLLHLRGAQRRRPDRLEAGGAVAHPSQAGDPARQAIAPHQRELPPPNRARAVAGAHVRG